MEKNAIKKFAVWARTEMLTRVAQRAARYGIEKDHVVDRDADSINGILLSETEKAQRRALIRQIEKKGYDQVIEEVAYTWFNRFIALRFMEVNGYLPSHIRVFTNENNEFKPELLSEAINLDIPGLDMQKVYKLQDENKIDELYRYLLIVQCNDLNSVLPKMFQHLNDYTELLLPDNLLRNGSVLEQMITLIPEEDWRDQVQIIGWMYQYYNSELKDEVFANLKKKVKISKDSIPAATQLFTPDWIVRYMVDNSLGRLWYEGHPSEVFKEKLEYYIDDAEQEASVQAQVDAIKQKYGQLKPEEIKCIDPCCGSGHILVYMFDVLIQIYQNYGYSVKEAVSKIIKNNLWGLDIDGRATQLAYFSVMMKARKYDRRFLSRGVQPNIFEIIESNGLIKDKIYLSLFNQKSIDLKHKIHNMIDAFYDAKEYGSILTFNSFNGLEIKKYLDKMIEADATSGNLFLDVLDQLEDLANIAIALQQKYQIVVTNPPYMGANNMSSKLSSYLKQNYRISKRDLSTVFMEKTMNMLESNGLMAMINIPVWMFLKGFYDLRIELLKKSTIINLVHPGRGIFGSDFGTVAFVLSQDNIDGLEGTYFKLFDKQGEVQSIDTRERQFLSRKGMFFANQREFLNIPGSPIAYWASKQIINDFNNPVLSDIASPRQGLATGENNRFLRLWFEPDLSKINFHATSLEDAKESQRKWFPYNKGGKYRKWYGNNDYVINWENDGFEIRNFKDKNGKQRSVLRNVDKYFNPAISWSKVSSGSIAFRYKPVGYIFDVAGTSIFANEDIRYYLLGFCNSSTALQIASILSPTLNYEVGQIANFPIIIDSSKKELVTNLVKENIEISKQDWDSQEISWDFKMNPLVQQTDSIEEAFLSWKKVCQNRFDSLKKHEEKLNRIFAEIYNLSGQVICEVDNDKITVSLAEYTKNIKEFISYAVGCMFGRFSLKKNGVVYASKEQHLIDDSCFEYDKDNIIPITDDDYFTDDIVGKFVDFTKAVYGSQKLEENLAFIANALDGKGTAREKLRNYFLNSFYQDHCAMYSGNVGKRPIYWLFDSGKKNGFKCLIYMHRYTPDTLARIRTDYVHPQQARYQTAIDDIERQLVSATGSEKVRLNKQLKKLKGQAEETRVFEEKLHHLADQMIDIDLDDGVKHNYALFKDVLAKIK
ncbi:BREX-1 system adenine-specific DNA-methyltransferase PglX [Lactobacillus equicursoris]|uniref:BREX-1 system adenine-specific DNA-methyltransferase PglX n=1 Tax=Lactobacillus equicursoris TaxID=420645 RepID=UPI003992423E